ncbi:MAG TPA: aldo/keto reductase [Acidobacteriota bacterium]
MTERWGRRRFLKTGLAAAAAPVLGTTWLQRPPPEPIMRYRTLGRTGLKVSEIGFGGYPIRDPELLRYAIERGINYIDTSDDYRGGASEETIGRGLRGLRDQVVLATKWHPWARTKKAEMLAGLDQSLRRLQTDHVDILQVHQVGKRSGGESIERLENQDLWSAYETAKQAGKVRFVGITGHDGDLMQVMRYVLDHTPADMILNRYSFLDYPEQKALFAEAKRRGIGVAVMKTLAGAKGQRLDPWRRGDATFQQAALRWTLSNPNIAVAVISISSRSQVDEYVGAVARAFNSTDQALLDRYAARYSQEYCRLCNACEPACPAALPIADTLRFAMYAEDYGDLERGRAAYAKLAPERRAAVCATCAAPCLHACPYKLDIRTLMGRADRLLA